MFSITKHIELDMAHRVPNHASQCRNLHGHRYRVVLHAVATTLGQRSLVEEGMVADFGVLKRALMRTVHHGFDHATCLYLEDPLVDQLVNMAHTSSEAASLVTQARRWEASNTTLFHGMGVTLPTGFTMLVPCVPTAEELARLWFLRCQEDLKFEQHVHLTGCTVYETPTSRAHYEHGALMGTPEETTA